MLLPYSSDRPPRNVPITVIILILIHYLIFGVFAIFWKLTNGNSLLVLFTNLSLVPYQMHWYSFITYGFLHEDVFHLSVNMLFLWVFGSSVEDAIGWLKFLLFYLMAMMVTGAIQAIIVLMIPGTDHMMPIIGASGAISALMGLYAVRFYRSKIRFVGVPFQIPAILVLAIFLISEMTMAALSLHHEFNQLFNAVAHWAHITGFLFGILAGQSFHMYHEGRRDYVTTSAEKDMKHGSHVSAAMKWDHLLALQPENLKALKESARCWILAGEREPGLQRYGRLLSALLKEGNQKEALAIYADMRTIDPQLILSSSETLKVASYMEENGDWRASLDILQALLDSSHSTPETEMVHLRIATLLTNSGSHNLEAAERLADFISDYPDSDFKGYADRMLNQVRERLHAENEMSDES